MIQKYKRQTNIGVGLGFVAQTLPFLVSFPYGTGLLVKIAGTALIIWGCSAYAKGKGHSGWAGLLGFLSVLGLIILIFLPDKEKRARQNISDTSSSSPTDGL